MALQIVRDPEVVNYMRRVLTASNVPWKASDTPEILAVKFQEQLDKFTAKKSVEVLRKMDNNIKRFEGDIDSDLFGEIVANEWENMQKRNGIDSPSADLVGFSLKGVVSAIGNVAKKVTNSVGTVIGVGVSAAGGLIGNKTLQQLGSKVSEKTASKSIFAKLLGAKKTPTTGVQKKGATQKESDTKFVNILGDMLKKGDNRELRMLLVSLEKRLTASKTLN